MLKLQQNNKIRKQEKCKKIEEIQWIFSVWYFSKQDIAQSGT